MLRLQKHRSVLFAGFLLASLLVSAATPLAAPGDAPSPEPAFAEGQIWAVKSPRVVTFEELSAALSSRHVIYLGEEHHNRWHVESALAILRALLAQGRRPILALEMFGWDGQAALDHYLSGQDGTAERFLKESRWEQNWGGAFADYEPLVSLAKAHRLSVLALNPPRPLVRLVATRGLTRALADPAMTAWGIDEQEYPEDAAYHEMITSPLRQCHDGLSDDDYQRMYEASLFRDEGMARTIAASFRRADAAGSQDRLADGPVVSYTGGGHIQYGLPVPTRVRRRAGAITDTTIYLTAFEPGRVEDIRRLFAESIADYVWLTPTGARGAPRRCR